MRSLVTKCVNVVYLRNARPLLGVTMATRSQSAFSQTGGLSLTELKVALECLAWELNRQPPEYLHFARLTASSAQLLGLGLAVADLISSSGENLCVGTWPSPMTTEGFSSQGLVATEDQGVKTRLDTSGPRHAEGQGQVGELLEQTAPPAGSDPLLDEKTFNRCLQLGVILAIIASIIYIGLNWKVLLTATESKPIIPDVSEEMFNLSSRSRKTDPDSLVASRTFMSDKAFPSVGNEDQKKVILVYNRPSWLYPDDRHYKKVLDDREGVLCKMTDNKSLSGQAAAVIVHVCEGSVRPPTEPRPPHQIWVAFAAEAPPYCSAFAVGNWIGIFNWTMSYRIDADIFTPYGAFSLQGENPGKNYTQIIQAKTKGVAWFVSHCNTHSGRDKYVQELQKYIQVDVFGRCGPLKCEDRCMTLLNTSYYFYLAFENSLCQDYVTEKFFKVYENINAIPVARGGADYERYFLNGTYINVADFSSPRDLAERLKDLMADQDSFAEMLRVKDRLKIQYSTFAKAHSQLCRNLHQPYLEVKVYQDISGWVRNMSLCRSPTDI